MIFAHSPTSGEVEKATRPQLTRVPQAESRSIGRAFSLFLFLKREVDMARMGLGLSFYFHLPCRILMKMLCIFCEEKYLRSALFFLGR